MSVNFNSIRITYVYKRLLNDMLGTNEDTLSTNVCFWNNYKMIDQ